MRLSFILCLFQTLLIPSDAIQCYRPIADMFNCTPEIGFREVVQNWIHLQVSKESMDLVNNTSNPEMVCYTSHFEMPEDKEDLVLAGCTFKLWLDAVGLTLKCYYGGLGETPTLVRGVWGSGTNVTKHCYCDTDGCNHPNATQMYRSGTSESDNATGLPDTSSGFLTTPFLFLIYSLLYLLSNN